MRWRVLGACLCLAFAGCLPAGRKDPTVTVPPRPADLPQHALAIIVSDDTGPVIGASVVLTPQALGEGPLTLAPTNADGYTVARAVRQGIYRIEVSADGHQAATVDQVESLANRDLRVHLALDRPRQMRGRLQAHGRALTYPDGAPFDARSVTAFRLIEQVAHGRENEAEAFLAWAQRTGFNTARVLSQLCCWFTLTPAEGEAALPRLLAMAAQHDMYLEVVALAATEDFHQDEAAMRAHVAAVGQACAAASNCVIELANENKHEGQSPHLADVGFLAQLRAAVPRDVPVAYGSNCCAADEGGIFPGGDYITVHLDRDRPDYEMVRRVRELEIISADHSAYVWNDEPKKFTSQIADCDVAFMFGVLNRGFGVGGTYHFDSGLQAQPPQSPGEQACAEAFVAGSMVFAPGQRFRFMNAGWTGSPVKSADFDAGVIRAYSFLDSETHGYLALVGVHGDPGLELQGGWAVVGMVAERGRLRLLELRK